MPTINHFEIPADDIDRAQRFYKDVFGWIMQKTSNPENPEKHKSKLLELLEKEEEEEEEK
jgi:predicted enzyme related to lactoylglutathione lyase